MRIHIFRIPTPFAVGPVNVYLIPDDPITLIDTGPKTEEAFRSLRDHFERVNVRMEDVRRIIITHTHWDHAGQAAILKKMSGATVFVHPWEAHRMAGDEGYMVGLRMLVQVGVPGDVVEQFEDRLRRYGAWIDPVPDINLLDEGDEVGFSTGDFRVLHTPGHTPGHLCLWREGPRLLVAGDTVLKRITPNPVMNVDPRGSDRRFPSLSLYLKTLDRLRLLGPTLIHTGHGEDVFDLELYCNEMVKHVRERQSRLLGLMPTHGVTAWDMSNLLFPNAGIDQGFLAVSEASAHLDLAVDQGKLVRDERDGIEYNRLTSR
jgi:glyoxylase-like metal-dependent hydrolase (beta-lactamase superfamily II)